MTEDASPRSSVLELRVHGTGGTPPEVTLCYPHTRRVAGEKLTGFYEKDPHGGETPDAHRVEAYSWGKLTSGNAARALWLLLLPFLLVNVCFWGRPRERLRKSPHVDKDQKDPVCSVFDFLVRLLALSLTAQLVLAAAAIGPNMLGWQCVRENRNLCGATHSLLAFMDSWWKQPGRRLVITALVPAVVLFLLAFLSWRTWRRYERHVPETEGGIAHPLSPSNFWDGVDLVQRLRALHLGVGCAVISAVLVYPALVEDRSSHGEVAAPLGLMLMAADVLLILAISGVLVVVSRREGLTRITRGVFFSALGLLVLTGVYVAWNRPQWTTTVTSRESNGVALPGYQGFVTGLVTAQVVALLALGVVTWLMRRSASDQALRHAALKGWVSPVGTALSMFLGGALAAGVTYQVKIVLGPAIQVPDIYTWISVGFSAELAVVLFGLVALVIYWRRRRCEMESQVDRDFEANITGQNLNRRRKIAGAYAFASLTCLAPWVLLVLALPSLILIISPIEVFADLLPKKPPKPLMPFINVGSWSVTAFAVILLILGWTAARKPQLLRIVGNLWDVGTFWPRSAHPLAPPCYAERVVPDLTQRTLWWCRKHPDGGVILSGHSQGSVIAVATFLQLPPKIYTQMRLITYGSPLRRLYARFFPAYFSTQQLKNDVLDQLEGSAGEPAWRNFYRRTDIITQALGIKPTVDTWVRDPKEFLRQDGDPYFPAFDRHGDYQLTEQYEEYIQKAIATLTSSRRRMPVTTPQAADPER